MLLATACAQEAPLRPQSVLYVNTDVPVPLLADTIRIEVLDPSGAILQQSTSVHPNPSDWPVSMGVAPSLGGGDTRIRLRLFGASHIAGRNPSELSDELEREDPLPSFVIDRIVDIEVPSDGVRHLELLLSGECMGVPADLVSGRSCVPTDAGPELDAEPSAGLTEWDEPRLPGAHSRAGKWDAALPVDCGGEPRADSALRDGEVCIPGGVFFFGDGRLGVNARVGESWASIPERLTRMSPFFMDRYEVTVGRIRAARAEGFSLLSGDLVPRAGFGQCNFASDGSTDTLPMNCIAREAAQRFCQFDGGRSLPSEARWEFVASGRGQERLYAWGDEPATCDRSVFARVGPELQPIFRRPLDFTLGGSGQCAHLGEGMVPVDSDQQDVTRDGVVGMAGNVQEWCLDSFIALTHDCWSQRLLRDPVCDVGGTEYIARGSIWSGVLASLPASLRKSTNDLDATRVRAGFTGFATGFRCVRDVTP